ncbi:ABC transporter permease [Halobacteriales archaeon QS_5_70_17]|nr:MAG: ABC transporter permease [Halobacteriales archaeon QS_5_70_17]
MSNVTDRERREARSGPYAATVRWMENLSDAKFAYLLLTPVLLLLGIIALWPLMSTFWTSLHADAAFGAANYGEFIGFENYMAILSGQRDALLTQPFFSLSRPFQSAVTVTLIFAFVSVAFETLIGFGQALVLDQDFSGRRWVRVAIILPWAIPIVIQGMLFFLLFQPTVGFLAGPLQSLGLLSSSPLSSAQDATMIIIVADVWKTSAFMALLILAGLQSIDRSLYDVAQVAGASKWQQFKYITFPLVLPSVLIAVLFRSIQAMRVYGLIETVAGCTVVPSLSCLVVTSWGQRQYGTASALAFLTALVIGIIVSVYIVRFADAESGGF